MGFVSNDAAGDRADKAGGSNSQSQSNQKGETDMSSGRESRENPINQVFDKIEDILSETWEQTGFGEVTIESEREKKNLIRVTVKGSTHYRYLITDEDVEEWKSRT